jgi:hypothetical protein
MRSFSRYIDGYYGTPRRISRTPREYPFRHLGDLTAAIYSADYLVDQGRYVPAARGSIECCIQIGGGGQRQFGQHGAGGGVDHLVRGAAFAGEPVAIDEQGRAGRISGHAGSLLVSSLMEPACQPRAARAGCTKVWGDDDGEAGRRATSAAAAVDAVGRLYLQLHRSADRRHIGRTDFA